MALGTNNQQNRGSYEPNYYSRLRFKNDTDNLIMGFSFWKGTLKISITEKQSGDTNTRAEDLANIYLSPAKAKMMAENVRMVLEHPEDESVKGINTGTSDTQGLLAIARENGKPYVLIGKVDKDGNFVQSQRFNFNYEYHYSLNFNDLQKLSFTKTFHNNLELEQFHDLLEDYARSANGAYGMTTCDIARYEVNKITNLMNQMGDKLGIERRGGGNYNNSNGGSGNSIFNRPSAGNIGTSNSGFSGMNKPTGSIEELEEEFE